MFSDIFQRFIQKRPVAMMVFILLENFLNADKLDRWFNVSYFFKNNKLFFHTTTGNIRSVVASKFRDGFLS
jgi:hypothetical protein